MSEKNSTIKFKTVKEDGATVGIEEAALRAAHPSLVEGDPFYQQEYGVAYSTIPLYEADDDGDVVLFGQYDDDTRYRLVALQERSWRCGPC